jgi:uncharacterized protein YkwD
VPAPRSLLVTTLSILSCSLLATPAVASGDASPGRATTAVKRQADCPTGPAHDARRAKAAARACRASARRTRTQKPAKTRPAKSKTHTGKPATSKSATTKSRAAKPNPTPAPQAAVPTPDPSTVPAVASPSAQSDAAAIAAVLATPCQNTELTPEAANIALVRTAVLCLINRKRAENGEMPLAPNPELEQAAEGHCAEMIADDYFAHVAPSGETPVDRIRDAGYIPSPSDGYVIGENLAWGTYQLSTPQSIVSAWIASPGHLANILEAQYRETGIGVVPAVPASLAAGAPGATYAQEFGVIIP